MIEETFEKQDPRFRQELANTTATIDGQPIADAPAERATPAPPNLDDESKFDGAGNQHRPPAL